MINDHRAIQSYLKKIIGKGEAFLEHPFPEIRRIADLYWPFQKIVFEVQISSINPKEVKARIRDYKSLGLTVVWILGEKQFNRRVISPVLRALEGEPYYFAGATLYDQVRLARNHRVIRRSPKMPILLERPKRGANTPFPQVLTLRSPSLYFTGDAIDRFSHQPDVWKNFTSSHKRRWCNPYRLLLDLLIERLT